MALAITDSNFEELLASGKPVVVDFWATRFYRYNNYNKKPGIYLLSGYIPRLLSLRYEHTRQPAGSA